MEWYRRFCFSIVIWRLEAIWNSHLNAMYVYFHKHWAIFRQHFIEDMCSERYSDLYSSRRLWAREAEAEHGTGLGRNDGWLWYRRKCNSLKKPIVQRTSNMLWRLRFGSHSLTIYSIPLKSTCFILQFSVIYTQW